MTLTRTQTVKKIFNHDLDFPVIVKNELGQLQHVAGLYVCTLNMSASQMQLGRWPADHVTDPDS